MRFWTFQRKELVKKLIKGESIKPDFTTQEEFYGCSKQAYRYIVELYGSVAGLIFGHIGNSKHPEIRTVSELYTLLEEVGSPSGTSFGPETHYLLEVEIPSYIPVMVIDFYKFSDLMFFMDEENVDEIELSKRVLLLPNNPDGTWQLKVGHIPEILLEWVVNIHTPRGELDVEA